MANRKAKPIEGDVCWFCKQPADHESWMGLGFLKSTSQPVFEGNYILYHEPCAVYSNGAGDVPAEGMDDETVLKFWLHGEKCSGIGLKCQLCGRKGATTGCLHGPCQQFYHYPCARVRAAQGHLQFSLQCRALACNKHLDMLPLPVEEQFLGMWMEGGGSWNGSLMAPAATSWLPHYEGYLAAFKARWEHLLTMVPADELRAVAAANRGKAKRRSRAGARGSNDRDDSDPEFRVKKSGRSSNPGGRARVSQSQLARGASAQDLLALQQQQQQQALGMPPATAQAAARQVDGAGPATTAPGADSVLLSGAELEAAGGAGRWRTRVAEQQQTQQQHGRSPDLLADEQLADGNGAAETGAQQWPELDCGLLLQAAGFGAPLLGQAAQQGGSVQLGQQALQAAAAAARGGNCATSSRTASGVARGGGTASSAQQGGASSADSAPASRGRPAGAAQEAAEADTAAAPAPAGAMRTASNAHLTLGPQQQQQQQQPGRDGAVSEQVSLELPEPGDVLQGLARKQEGLGVFPIRRAAPAVLRLQQLVGAAPAQAAAAAGGAAAEAAAAESSEGGMSFSAGMFHGPVGAVDSRVQVQQGQQGQGYHKRKYLDVNAYMQTGTKVLTQEAYNPPGAAGAGAGAAEALQHSNGKPRASRSQLGDCPSTSSLSRTLHSQSAGGLPAALLGTSPLTAAGDGLPGAAAGSGPGLSTPRGWPGSYRGTDMFSWLQQQVQRQPGQRRQQQQQQGKAQLSPGSGGGGALSGGGGTLQGPPATAASQQQHGLALDLSAAGFDSQQAQRSIGGAAGGITNSSQALQALARAIQHHVDQAPSHNAAGAPAAAAGAAGGGLAAHGSPVAPAAAAGGVPEPHSLVSKMALDAAAAAAAALAAAAAAAGMTDKERGKLVEAVVKAAKAVSLSTSDGGGNDARCASAGNGIAAAAAAAVRESSTQVPMLLRQLGSGSALSSPKLQQQQQGVAAIGSPHSPLAPLSPRASLAAAVAAATTTAPLTSSSILQQLLQQLLQQQQQQQRSPDCGKPAAVLSGLPDLLRQGVEKLGSSTGTAAAAAAGGAAGVGGCSSQVLPSAAAVMSELAAGVLRQSMAKLGGSTGTAAGAAGAAAGGATAAASDAVLPRVSEYFGCVTSLPPLLPGELRAAGVTAHPNVVAAFVRQRGSTALLALQPWSIVVPLATQQQLAACGVQPSQFVGQLHGLLHASNVLNNHLTNAAAPGSGAAASSAAALLAGQQSGGAGLSGGYAGMPQDLPVRYVRGGFVGPGDPRQHLQGEFTLTALQDLEPGTILGPWRSYALTQEDYGMLMQHTPPDWQAPPGASRDTAWLELLHKYTLALRVPALEGHHPLGTTPRPASQLLYFCALGHGNLTCLANDPLIDPLAAAHSPASSSWDAADLPCIGPPNVGVVVVLVNGLPLPLMVTTQAVRAGDQVCYSYGKAYWHAWASLRAAMAAEQAGGRGLGARSDGCAAAAGRQQRGLVL